MADQQGTGKHPHKSAAEPYEHHEAPTTKAGSHNSGEHASSSQGSSSSQSGEQGTGKHSHKSSSDPKEHHEGAKASK